MTAPRSANAFRVFAVVAALGIWAVFAGYRFYGDIIRGTDADYPYALAHSIVFDFDTDITNNLSLGESPAYLDPDGDRSFARVPRRPDGGFRTKWPMGLSLVEAPLLALAHGARRGVEWFGVSIEGPPGYSRFEIVTVANGLVLVVAFGLALGYRMAEPVFGTWPAVAGVAACWLGTSLFYYTSVQPFWAHGVSFSALAVLLWTCRPLWTEPNVNRALIGFGAALGMVYLIRPQQALIAVFLLPVLLRVVLTRRAAGWVPGAVVGLILCGGAILAQGLMNLGQFGVFTLNAYQAAGERFVIPFSQPRGDLPYPRRIQVALFDIERGLLYFSPVVVLAAVGLAWCRRRIPPFVWPFAANAVAQVFVIAAWHPRQGESFGSRMWTDAGVVVVFGVAALVAGVASSRRPVVAGAVGVATGWTCYLLARSMGVI